MPVHITVNRLTTQAKKYKNRDFLNKNIFKNELIGKITSFMPVCPPEIPPRN